MKNRLQLCALALNPVSPSPTAKMVKIEDEFMVAYGGTFCIRTPLRVEVGACFNPAAVTTFFRKDRKAVSYTLHKKKLILQEGKEKLSVPYLAPEEMVTIDVLGAMTEISLDLMLLKSCLEAVDPVHAKIQCQGVSFRYGMAEASNGNVVISAVTDLPDEFEFNLPHASAKALLRFKSELIGISQDEQAVKFHFKDGSSLTSLCICEQLIDTTVFYSGVWRKLKLKPEFAKDLLDIDCDLIHFEEGFATYIKEDSRGRIEEALDPDICVTMSKPHLDMLLRISADLRLCDNNSRLMAVSDNCRAISTTRHLSK